jgi:hypothetical protein
LKLVRFLNKSTPNCGNTRGSDDVVGEYAVYMRAKTGLNARKNGRFDGLAGAANLDALPRSPYTSAVPWMDVILNPAPHPKRERRAGWKRI